MILLVHGTELMQRTSAVSTHALSAEAQSPIHEFLTANKQLLGEFTDHVSS